MEKDPRRLIIISIFSLAVLFIWTHGIDFGGKFYLWLLYTVLATIAEIFPVELPQIGTVSVGFAINYATLLSFKPGAAALSAGIAMFLGNHGRPLGKKLFNFGQITLAAGVASSCFHSFWPDLVGTEFGKQFFAASLAAIVYSLINVLLVTWIFYMQISIREFLDNLKWSFPNYLSLALFGLLIAYNVYIFGIWGVMLFIIPLIGSRYIFQVFKRIHSTYDILYQSIYSIHEMRDSFTRGHAERVSFYAKNMAKEMGLTKKEIDDMALAGMLHDIGKVAISDEILNKPGKLTESEKAVMDMHVLYGYNLVGKFSFYPSEMANIVRYHHEWYNGEGGYPHEVSGEKIPFASRLLAVCDAFDAMTTTRPYRVPISPEQAVGELIKGRGVQFDPQMVDSFITMIKNKGLISNTTEEVEKTNAKRKCS